MAEEIVGRALREPALVSDQAPAGLDPSGFDPERDRLAALRQAQANVTAALRAAIPKGHRCGPIEATEEQFGALEAAHEAEEAAAAALMPTEQDAIRLMHDAYSRLKALGWNDATYCPKDGSTFDSIEAGSTGIFSTHYSGEWPDGHWWIEDGGDLYPSRPILYRVTEAEKAKLEELRGRFRALRDSDQSGEAGQTAEQAGPEGRERGPSEASASPNLSPSKEHT